MGKGESSTSRSGGSGAHLSILLKKSNGSYGIEQNAGPSARSKNSARIGGSSNGMDTNRNPVKSQMNNNLTLKTPTSHIAYDPASDDYSTV